jgi:hypothetical protein
MISNLAAAFGWSWMHIRPARTDRSGVWKTPVDGPLGVGWPDLFLVRGSRTVVIETKLGRESDLTDDQRRVLGLFRDAGVETYVATPRNIKDIEEVLR